MYTKIMFLKNKIKQLGELQTKTKLARKTSMPKGEWLLLKAELAPKSAYWDHAMAASDARLRKIEITACLNLYHELRWSAYRHAGEGYWYDKAIQSLKTELDKA